MHFKWVQMVFLTGSSQEVFFQLFKDEAVLSWNLFMRGEKWCNDALKMSESYVPADLQKLTNNCIKQDNRTVNIERSKKEEDEMRRHSSWFPYFYKQQRLENDT